MKAKLVIGLMLGALGVSAAVYAADSSSSGERITELLKTRLPRTVVTQIDCSKVEGICEVIAGKSLFYVDHSARYLIVGRVYDMQARQDLTAAKLLELNPSLLLGNAANAGGDIEPGSPPPVAQLGRHDVQARTNLAPGTPQRIDLASLPASGAITWGKPSGAPVTIFTDFHCGYCRALAQQLEQMDVKVVERPISTLGSREVANRVLCARDRPKAIKAAYAGDDLPQGTCDTSGLDANEKFAREHGFTGTPILVRRDGAVLEGFRPRAFLETWLKEAR